MLTVTVLLVLFDGTRLNILWVNILDGRTTMIPMSVNLNNYNYVSNCCLVMTLGLNYSSCDFFLWFFGIIIQMCKTIEQLACW